MNSYCLLRASTAIAIHLNNQMKKIILMAPYSVPFSEVQTVARLFPTIHDHCRRVSLPVLLMSFASCLLTSVGCSLSQVWFQNLIFLFIFSHFSPYLRSKLINICFFCHFKLFLWLIFPSLFVLFLQTNHPTNLTCQTKEPRQTVSSNHSVDNGWEICSPDLSESSDGLTPNPICPTHGQPSLGPPKIQSIQFGEKMREKKELYCKGQFWPPFTQLFFWLLLSSRCSYPVTINFIIFVFCLYPNSDLNK